MTTIAFLMRWIVGWSSPGPDLLEVDVDEVALVVALSLVQGVVADRVGRKEASEVGRLR